MILLLRIFFLFCTFYGFSQNAKFSAFAIDPSLIENADSVVSEERISIDISDPQTLYKTIYKVVSVYNKAGNSDVQAYVFYDDDRKVKNVRATIYDALGNEKEVFKERDFRDISAVSGATLYADDRVLFMDYTPTSYPYTVVFESETRSKTTAFLPRWIPVANYGSSTAHSTFEILYDPATKLNIKEERLENYGITHTQQPGIKRWEAKNIKAVKKEYRSPSFEQLLPVVKCAVPSFSLKGVNGTASSWKDLGTWMDENLIAGTGKLPEETVARILDLVKDLPTDKEKAEVIYKYVQDKVRYISVQVGIGGWKPMLAADVDRLGYGDCKALSNYTKSLLEVAGIPSYYTVLYGDTSKKSIDTDFIAMQGNHVILALPLEEQMTWLECTSQEVPFGYLGDFTDDRDVLVITKEGGELRHTKIYAQEENLEHIQADFKINMEGDITGSLNKSSQGIFYGDRLALNRLDTKELKKYYLKKWGAVNRLEIDAITLKNDRDSVIFNEELELKATGYLTTVNNDYLLKPNFFGFTSSDIPARYEHRKTPFVLERGSIDEVALSFSLPEGFSADALPEPLVIETAFGNYQAQFSAVGQKINYTRTFSLNEGTYQPETYDAFRDFYKDVVRGDAQKLLIKTKS